MRTAILAGKGDVPTCISIVVLIIIMATMLAPLELLVGRGRRLVKVRVYVSFASLEEIDGGLEKWNGC